MTIHMQTLVEEKEALELKLDALEAELYHRFRGGWAKQKRFALGSRYLWTRAEELYMLVRCDEYNARLVSLYNGNTLCDDYAPFHTDEDGWFVTDPRIFGAFFDDNEFQPVDPEYTKTRAELEQAIADCEEAIATVESNIEILSNSWRHQPIKVGDVFVDDQGKEYTVSSIGDSKALLMGKDGWPWSYQTSKLCIDQTKAADMGMFGNTGLDEGGLVPIMNEKKLKNEKKPGVYRVLNILNGKVLIGYSEDIDNAEDEMYHLLDSGTHWNRHFQNAWNKYGADKFDFLVLDIEGLNTENLMGTFVEALVSHEGVGITLYNY